MGQTSPIFCRNGGNGESAKRVITDYLMEEVVLWIVLGASIAFDASLLWLSGDRCRHVGSAGGKAADDC